ncbi:MAG: hypothetical protein OYL92_06610 [Acidobacteriota bacterium]|nr:hypothetical protein [Acidobacteriota bacterium]MDE3264625.1 hypothetical protein [Acidobacteriota bacterium]
MTLSILAIGFILAVTLVVGHARKATLHGALAARFRDLEATFAHQKELTQEEFRELNERRLAIEVDEPSPKRLLSALCYFEVLRSTRSDLDIAAELKKVPWWRRRAAQILSQTEWMVEKLQTPKTVEPAPGR